MLVKRFSDATQYEAGSAFPSFFQAVALDRIQPRLKKSTWLLKEK